MAKNPKYLASLLSAAIVLITFFHLVTRTNPKPEVLVEYENDSSQTESDLLDEDEYIETPYSSVEDQTRRDSIVNFGLKLLGTPYTEAGGNTDGFDCSGFVYFVFKNFGVDVPRSSSLFKDFGNQVDINQVQKGDVLVFLSPTRDEIGHIGIVTKAKGMETEFVHSSSGKAMGVTVSSLKNEGYKKRFVKAVDVLGEK